MMIMQNSINLPVTFSHKIANLLGEKINCAFLKENKKMKIYEEK